MGKSIDKSIDKSVDKKELNSLDDFVADSSIIDTLKFAIGASKVTGEPLKHIFLYGAGGLGKSALAELIHKEYNPHGKFCVLFGPKINNDGTIVKDIKSLKDGDVLFIDEVHAIKPVIREMLYSIIQDNVMHVTSPTQTKLAWPVAKITIIAATTDMFKLTDSFIDRFPFKIELLPYTQEQLIKIVQLHCNMDITYDACKQIAESSNGVARVAVESLRRIVTFAQFKQINKITLSDVIECFKIMAIDPHGLTRTQREYIDLLADNFMSGMSIDRIATILNKPREEITRFIEPYLVKNGYIEVSSRGRSITQKGLNLTLAPGSPLLT